MNFKHAISGWSTVLIKVNFITTKTWDTGATTDPLVVEGIIKKLQEMAVKIYVVESDATMTNADKAFEMTGMRQMCTQHDVECLNLRHEKDRIKITVPDGEVLRSVKVPRIVAESAIISAANSKLTDPQWRH